MKAVIGALAGLGIVSYAIYKMKGSNQETSATMDMGNNIAVTASGKLSPQTVALFAQQAGFSGNDLQIAVAIALAESGGNTDAYNPETAAGTPSGLGSFGLWQIYLKTHPEYASWDLTDPQSNAQAAYQIYRNAGGFSPWSTYKNGAYQAHMAAASDAVNA